EEDRGAVHDITTPTRHTETAQRCLRCGFHPASPRIGGYCSWDCYDADDSDDDGDEEGDSGAGRRRGWGGTEQAA
ncbi:MAG TPA: hypothetical protein VMF35_02120, partial [Acidimicrobiales bacterium]|nr:hypothetical protein [Acidimicrobiales bacterium]